MAPDLDEFDPYSVLGIHHDATFEEARAVYRRRAQLLHPDRHADAPEAVRVEAAAAMRELNDAFESLRNRLPTADRSTSSGGGPRLRCPVCKREYPRPDVDDEFTCQCETRLRRDGAARSQQEMDIHAIDDLADQGLLTNDEHERLLRVVSTGAAVTCTRTIPVLRVKYDAGEMSPDEYANSRLAAVYADLRGR